jgi:hypothetical protein
MLVTEVITPVSSASCSVKLLEHREQDADPDDRQQPATGLAQHRHARVLVLADQCLDDLGDLRLDVAADEPAQHRTGRDQVVLGHQVARRLRNRQCQHAVDQRRDGQREEHPAPGGDAEPQWVGRRAGDGHQAEVHQQGDEDAGHDGHLLQ